MSRFNLSFSTEPEAETSRVSPPSFMLPVPKIASSDWNKVRDSSLVLLSLSSNDQLPAAFVLEDVVDLSADAVSLVLVWVALIVLAD